MQKKTQHLDHDQLLQSLQLQPTVQQKLYSNKPAPGSLFAKSSNTTDHSGSFSGLNSTKPINSQSRFGNAPIGDLLQPKRNHLLVMTIDIGKN